MITMLLLQSMRPKTNVEVKNVILFLLSVHLKIDFISTLREPILLSYLFMRPKTDFEIEGNVFLIFYVVQDQC